jgi:hypothetical protein
VTEIKRIEGALFRSREDAMKAGLEVAKKWVDEEGINQRQKMNVSLVATGNQACSQRRD